MVRIQRVLLLLHVRLVLSNSCRERVRVVPLPGELRSALSSNARRLLQDIQGGQTTFAASNSTSRLHSWNFRHREIRGHATGDREVARGEGGAQNPHRHRRLPLLQRTVHAHANAGTHDRSRARAAPCGDDRREVDQFLEERSQSRHLRPAAAAVSRRARVRFSLEVARRGETMVPHYHVVSSLLASKRPKDRSSPREKRADRGDNAAAAAETRNSCRG